jgi:iron complex outermembrane receptor protein
VKRAFILPIRFAADQKSDVAYTYDFDGSPTPVAAFPVPNLISYNKTAEIQLVSNDTSWGSDWLKWTFGGYYFDGEQGFDPAFFKIGLLDPGALLGTANNLLGELGLPPLDLTPGLVDLIGFTQAGDIRITGLMGTESLAFYTQETLTVTDWMDVTIGARYTEEERWLINSSSEVVGPNGGTVLPIQSYSVENDPSLRVKTYSFDPKISFDFRPSVSWLGDEPLVYVSYQSATKSAIFNAVNIIPRTDALLEKPEPLKKERIKAYEAGIKTAVFDGMMTLNAAVFNYEIENPQVQFISLFAGGAVQFENAGKQRQRGIEFDFMTPLFPSIFNDLVLSGGALFLDAEYTEFKNASGFDENGLFSNTNDYTGNDVVRSPEFSGNIGIVKTWAVGDGDLELGIDYAHMGSFYWAAKNTDNVQQDSYGLLGARMSYIYNPWGMRVTAFGRNLTDSDYNYSLFETDFGTMAAAAAPMSYGLRLNFDY